MSCQSQRIFKFTVNSTLICRTGKRSVYDLPITDSQLPFTFLLETHSKIAQPTKNLSEIKTPIVSEKILIFLRIFMFCQSWPHHTTFNAGHHCNDHYHHTIDAPTTTVCVICFATIMSSWNINNFSCESRKKN